MALYTVHDYVEYVLLCVVKQQLVDFSSCIDSPRAC